MKLATTLLTFAALPLLAGEAPNSSGITSSMGAVPADPLPAPIGAFDSAIRPITNPTLFDLAVPRTQLHAIYMHQWMPSTISTIVGDVPLGGDFNLYALQAEYALNERFSLVALKDGYIDFNPDSTLSNQEGFADLAAGVKYALIYLPEKQYILSAIATVELPSGESEVWQGEGDGAVNLILSDLKLYNNLQLAGAGGIRIPFSDSDSTTGFLSAHLSYRLCDWFIPVIEANWYHVFEEGNGTHVYQNQGGSLVPSVATFEGGDLINLGSANAEVDDDIVTLGVGFRSELTESLSIGAAYEFPLTHEDENLMEQRLTVDLVWKF